MPYISVDIDVDLDEFDTNDLIEELEDRIKGERSGCKGFGDRQRARLIKMLKKLKYGDMVPQTSQCGPSLLDQMKVEVLIEAKERYSLDQLKSLLQL
jgi:hypothetical protein